MERSDKASDRQNFVFRRTFSIGRDVPEDGSGDPAVKVVPIAEHVHRWEFGGQADAGADERRPKTYYEAFTGEAHPHTDFLLSAHRVLDLVLWGIVLAIPLALVVLGIVNGESAETIVLMAFFGAFIGMLFRHSFPRSKPSD